MLETVKKLAKLLIGVLICVLISILSVLFKILESGFNMVFDMFPIFGILYNNLYDKFLGDHQFVLSTPNLFNNVLIDILNDNEYSDSKKVKILDFGCGNGVCYTKPETINLINSRDDIQIVGIDINKPYIDKCIERINRLELSGHNKVQIKLQDIYTYEIDDKEADGFDYVLFTESAPLMSNKMIKGFINHIEDKLLKPNGKIIFINNLVDNSCRGTKLEYLKPYYKYMIGIDFGRALYRDDFENMAKNTKHKHKAQFKIINAMQISKISQYWITNKYVLWLNKKLMDLLAIPDIHITQYKIILTKSEQTDQYQHKPSQHKPT